MNLKNKVNYELLFYFICWISCVFYSIYSAAKSAHEYFQSNDYEDTYNDFTQGWWFLNRSKDNSDNEWKYVKILLIKSLPWYIIHLTVAEILRRSYQQYLIYWYTVISFLFLTTNFGIKTLLFLSSQSVLGYAVLQLKSKTAVWIFFIVYLAILNAMKFVQFEIFGQDYYYIFFNMNGIFWVNLRTLNYFLEAVNDKNIQKINLKNIFTCLSYSLYLPFLFTGPIVLFTDFKAVFNSEHRSLFIRLQHLAKNLLRYIFWAFFLELSLHFIYINALTFQVEVVENLNSWALYGTGYYMGQFFQMKYVVFYGLSSTLSNFEGVPMLKTPICIGRVHLYSEMWKHFDRGLYLFLLKYIYIPLNNNNKKISRKIFASFVCFVFIFVWHGMYDFVVVWSALNFIGVVVETISYEISKLDFIKTKIISKMSDDTYRRLKCVIATPLFAMSCISNFYFFAAKQIGDIYAYRILTDPLSITVNVFIILYFGCQISTELKLWERSKCKKVP